VSGRPAVEPAPPHLARIADRLRELTVEVSTGDGGGAGIVWAPDLVVTNAHVIRAPGVRVGLPDDGRVEARLVAADRRADLAVLRIPTSPASRIVFGDSDALRVGALVVALGHPLGLRRTLTAGIVHALPPAPPGARRWIQLDLRLAPGNSGGPLADTDGRIVGITTLIAGGLAFAIPINEVRRFVAATVTSPP
jgi:serine protease Do